MFCEYKRVLTSEGSFILISRHSPKTWTSCIAKMEVKEPVTKSVATSRVCGGKCFFTVAEMTESSDAKRSKVIVESKGASCNSGDNSNNDGDDDNDQDSETTNDDTSSDDASFNPDAAEDDDEEDEDDDDDDDDDDDESSEGSGSNDDNE